MEPAFYRHNSADQDKKLEAELLEDSTGLPVHRPVVAVDTLTGSQGLPVLEHGVAIAQKHFPDHAGLNAFGEASISGAAAYDLWRGPTAIKPGPVTAGFQASFVSTSADDTLLGSGVRKLRMQYLDTAGSMQVEDVDMNGLTPVVSVATDIMFIQCIHSISNGTYGGAAVGSITVSNGATVMNYLPAGGNRCTSGHRMVPAGKVLFIKSWAGSSAASTSSKRTVMRLRTTSLENGDVFPGTFLFRSSMVCLDSALALGFYVPLRIPALSEVKITATTAGSADVAGEFFGWLENA